MKHAINSKEKLIAKFEPNFQQTEGCWNWLGRVDKSKGYGWFCLGRGWPGGGHGCNAMRAAYALYVGEIPSGLHVCHTCDNRLCVNPAHLFLGTTQENNADKVRKKRHLTGERLSAAVLPHIPKGSRHYKTKLTEDDALRIIEMRRRGAMYKDIGAAFGISDTAAYKIAKRKRWKHLEVTL
jgi:hypothetical protein